MEEGENRNGRGGALSIFWDLKSCPIPEGVNQADIGKNIVAALRGRVPEASNYDLQSFLAYGDPSDFPDHLLRTWERDGLKLRDSGGGHLLCKNMVDDLVAFALDHIFSRFATVIVLISAETEHEWFLDMLDNYGFRVVFTLLSDLAQGWRSTACLCGEEAVEGPPEQ